jgi:hypothetical protein
MLRSISFAHNSFFSHAEISFLVCIVLTDTDWQDESRFGFIPASFHIVYCCPLYSRHRPSLKAQYKVPHVMQDQKTKQNNHWKHNDIHFLFFSVALMQDYRPYIEHSWSKLKHTTRQTATEIGSQELWTKLAGSLGKYHIRLCPACSRK